MKLLNLVLAAGDFYDPGFDITGWNILTALGLSLISPSLIIIIDALQALQRKPGGLQEALL